MSPRLSLQKVTKRDFFTRSFIGLSHRTQSDSIRTSGLDGSSIPDSGPVPGSILHWLSDKERRLASFICHVDARERQAAYLEARVYGLRGQFMPKAANAWNYSPTPDDWAWADSRVPVNTLQKLADAMTTGVCKFYSGDEQDSYPTPMGMES